MDAVREFRGRLAVTHRVGGVHTAYRLAKFKKLTPKIILAELKRITDKLSDPLDCFGHTIIAKDENGRFL